MHKDSDGYCSAGIVYRYLKEKEVPDTQIYFHGINYGMPVPEEINYEKDTVYMVDFSLQPADVMLEFAEKLGDRFIHIDHHQSSVDMEEEVPALQRVPGIRQVHYHGDKESSLISGAELTWFYLYQKHSHPPAVQLVGEWDTWRYTGKSEERQEDVTAFQYYLQSVNSNPAHRDGRRFWYNILGGAGDADLSIPREGLTSGRALMAYQHKQWKSVLGNKGFTADFQGLTAVMVNQQGNSTMFKGFFDPEEHDIMVTYQEVHGEYLTVSMYTPKTDILNLGVLAKKIGEAGDRPSGGGHAGAAGFQCGWEYFKTLYDVIGNFG